MKKVHNKAELEMFENYFQARDNAEDLTPYEKEILERVEYEHEKRKRNKILVAACCCVVAAFIILVIVLQ